MVLFPRTVLIVDDEPLIRFNLAETLMDEGFSVVEAANVLEAVAILGKTHIDALVTDVDMPGGLDGFDLARLVRRLDPRVAIVITSGGRTCRDAKMPDGCAFLAKPYRLEDVLATIIANAGEMAQSSLCSLAG